MNVKTFYAKCSDILLSECISKKYLLDTYCVKRTQVSLSCECSVIFFQSIKRVNRIFDTFSVR